MVPGSRGSRDRISNGNRARVSVCGDHEPRDPYLAIVVGQTYRHLESPVGVVPVPQLKSSAWKQLQRLLAAAVSVVDGAAPRVLPGIEEGADAIEQRVASHRLVGTGIDGGRDIVDSRLKRR